MDRVAQLAKEEFSMKVGRQVTDEEAAEHAMHLRRLAAFLIDCAKDAVLMERLGLKKEGERHVAPRAVDNTSQIDRNPPETRRSTETLPPTASSRDAVPHRDSSVSIASASRAGPPASALNHVPTGASVDGSQ